MYNESIELILIILVATTFLGCVLGAALGYLVHWLENKARK